MDDLPGSTRNQDLVVLGQTPSARVLLDVEGKTDEPFDRLIREKLWEAHEVESANPRPSWVPGSRHSEEAKPPTPALAVNLALVVANSYVSTVADKMGVEAGLDLLDRVEGLLQRGRPHAGAGARRRQAQVQPGCGASSSGGNMW